MTDKTQPEALRLADALEYCDASVARQAINELRRQHARIAELEAQLEAVGAGGVQALSAAPAIGDELRDTLVAVSAAIAERDDRAAQAMLREILAAPQPSTTPPADSHPAPVLLSDEELCQIEEPYLLNFRIPLGGQYDFARAVEKAVLAKTYGTQAPQPSPTPQAEQQAAPKAAPGEQNAVSAEWLEQAYREGWAACRDAETIGEEAEDWAFGNSTANSRMIDAQQAAPQQEAQEPALFVSAKQLADLVNPSHATGGSYLPARKTRAGLFTQPLYTAPHPQPAPAPLSEQDEREAVARAIWELMREHEDRCDMELDDLMEDHPIWSYADAACAAIAAQKDTP